MICARILEAEDSAAACRVAVAIREGIVSQQRELISVTDVVVQSRNIAMFRRERDASVWDGTFRDSMTLAFGPAL